MRVVVAFHDLPEASDLGDAFWLADTSTNRARAEEAWAARSTHVNSAMFSEDFGVLENDDVLERLNDIDQHQPEWSEIYFFSVALTPELQFQLRSYGFIAERCADGFKVER